MSPSINSKLRSLMLADQALGLPTAPKISPQVSPQAAPTHSNASTTKTNFAEKSSPPKVSDAIIASAPYTTSPSVRHATQSAAPNLATQEARGIAEGTTMQWGVIRELPNSLPERAAALEEIRARHNATCPLCSRNQTHTNIVMGEGSPTAELFFIGEAPGEQEDLSGRPFMGRSGQKLDQMMEAMGFNRDLAFISNVLKIRPPDNRNPTQTEVDQCGPFLLEQLMVIRPKVIVTLGGPATKLILGVDEGITLLRGVWASWIAPQGVKINPIPVMPTFHPAYLIRNYTVQTRAQVWSDLQMALSQISKK